LDQRRHRRGWTRRRRTVPGVVWCPSRVIGTPGDPLKGRTPDRAPACPATGPLRAHGTRARPGLHWHV